MNQHVEVTRDHAWSGSRYINMRDPQPGDMSLTEIATGLSREQRFGGAATSIFWSVAQHSLLAVRHARQDHINDLQTLRVLFMHDAPEYMLRDLIRPLKANVPSYAPLEAAWWSAIADRFDLPRVMPPIVKKYDDLTLAVEKRWLIDPLCGDWPGLPDPGDRRIPDHLLNASMTAAREMFLSTARDLGIS